MSRFFVSPEAVDEENGVIRIGPDDSSHITGSLRLLEGDELEVADTCGRIYRTRIKAADPEGVTVEILSDRTAENEPGLELTLFQALPKGRKMDDVVRRVTELGVSRVVPIFTERTVVRLGPQKVEKRTARWRRIVREAAKQSKRGELPEVTAPVELAEVEQHVNDPELLLVPWLGAEQGIRGLLTPLADEGTPRRAAIFIGPEGGFARSEVELIRSWGGRPVSLGPRILRTETAGLVVAALLFYQFGEME